VGLIFLPSTLFVQQTPPPQGAAASAQTAPAPEITTQETQPGFALRARANEVLVRVVVRDAHGQAVTNLARDDFRLLDNGTRQVIRGFSLEFAHPAATRPVEKSNRPSAEKPPEKVESPAAPPQRFVALYFDDTFMAFDDVVRTRKAATHYLETAITPGDRVGLFTSSGQQEDVEFTSDLSALEKGLAKLRPNPHTPPCKVKEEFYEAYNAYWSLETGMGGVPPSSGVHQGSASGGSQATAGGPIVNPRVDTALQLAPSARMAWAKHRITAVQSLARLEALVRRLSAMPGQRTLVWISPGFLAMDQDDRVTSLIEQALRAHVVVSALDSRGVWTPETGIDFCIPGATPPPNAQAADLAAGDVLAVVATGTGGILFHDNNDFDAGFRLAGGLPEAAYLLSFSPAELEYDGKFHNLTVQLVNGRGLSVQARKGYFAPSAPPGSEPATTVAEEELEQDVFSQGEVQTVPLTLDTQFFKTATDEAKLTVLARLDVSHLHLKKQNGRNLDHLTVITALFSYAGEFVTGNRQTVDLRLLDQSLARLKQAGLSLPASFLVKPGQYLVRAVVGERDEGEVSAGNTAVDIP
jgi:VWFA-related protein